MQQSELSRGRSNTIFTVLLLSSMIGSFIHTALSVAIVPIMQDLSITASVVQWLTSIYSLIMGIMVLASAYLIRRFEVRQLFLVSSSIFISGLVLAGIAQSFQILLIGRMLQAVGGGIMLTLNQVVTLTIFPKHRHGTMMGIVGLAVTAVPVLSPTIAGVLIDQFSWQMLFWLCVPIYLLILVGGGLVMRNVTSTEKQRFDIMSMLLCSIALTGLLLGIGQIGSFGLQDVRVWLPLMAGIGGGILFTLRQMSLEQPLIDLKVFTDKPFRLAVIFSIVMYALLIGGSILVPIYIQSLRGLSATQSGLITMPGSLATAACSLIAGRLYDAVGIRKIALFGTVLMLLGSIGFILWGSDTALSTIILLFIVRQAGVGILLMPIFTWGMSKLSKKQYSSGTSLLSSLRTVAGALGAAAFVSVMTVAAGFSSPPDQFWGVKIAFALMSVLAAILFILAAFKIGKSSISE